MTTAEKAALSVDEAFTYLGIRRASLYPRADAERVMREWPPRVVARVVVGSNGG